jgi:hypothetical protein
MSRRGAGWAGKVFFHEPERREIWFPQTSFLAVEVRASTLFPFIISVLSVTDLLPSQPSRQRAAFPSKSSLLVEE